MVINQIIKAPIKLNNINKMHTKNNKFKEKQNIRKYIRTLRRSVKYSEQYTAAQLITNKILTLNYIHKAKNIAIFISIDGEIRTDLLIKTLLSMNKHLYLPKLPAAFSKSKYLSFTRYTLSTPLIRNYLTAYEP